MASGEVAQCLAATLSPDTNTRIAAELRLAELLKTPEAALALSSLVLAADAELSLRKMSKTRLSRAKRVLMAIAQHSAVIVLRKYVLEHWSPFFSQFKGAAPPVETKVQIRQIVFQGLSDPTRNIRTLCAHTLSSIANSDWPDEYPDLLNSLINLLSSQSPDAVHGAMQLFTEFIKSDLTEDQILPVLRQLLPVLLNILGASEQHSALTRARTISVFRQCVEALYMVKDQYPQAVKEATSTVLPVWLDAFQKLLALDPRADVQNTPTWDGLAIRIQIFKTLDLIQTSFHRTLAPFNQQYLSSALHHLDVLFPTFQQYYLQSAADVPRSSEEETIELTHLVCPMLDFVANVARSGKAKEWFEGNNLTSLIGAVFSWAQITSEDEDEWASNANAFVAQETDETLSYSVRMAGFDLLAILLERSSIVTLSTFQSTIHRFALESEQGRNAGNSDWWRPLEAALAAVGTHAEEVLEVIEDEGVSGRGSPIDIASLLTNVVPSLLTLSQVPFLQGRAFVFASQYAKLLPSQLAGQYLDAAVQVLEASEAGVPVKVSAVKAIHNFCQNIDESVSAPMAPRIVKDIGPFLPVTSEDTLTLVLEALSAVVDIDDGKWMTDDLARSIVAAVLEVWMKNNKDPIFISIITNVLESLASSPTPGVYATVVQQALPPLCNAIMASTAVDPYIASAAIELVTSLVEGAPKSGLGEGFFALLAPSLFSCLNTAEDRDVIQNGISCLTLIIRKDIGPLLAWRDPSNGQSGLDSVLAIIARQLQSDDESGGLFIGDLIIHLFRRAGDAVLPVLPQLLQAMANRMTTAKTATFLQSLVIPFAFLIHNQRDTLLGMLETTTVDGGRTALDVLIQTWCENAETFQGFWAIRISNLALSSLFASERPSLQNLIVKGDIIVTPETKNVIMTRSKTKQSTPAADAPTEFTAVPFPVKALKLLLHDLQSGGEAAAMGFSAADVPEVDSDDEGEEWTEEERLHQGFKADELAFLSDMIGPRGVAFDNDEALDDSDDEDLKSDPVSTMDMRAHLLSFLKECAARNTSNFSGIVDQLSAEEALVIRRAVTEQQ